MASASQCRSYVKEKGSSQQSAKMHSSELPDEIALRDEILQLKRQMIALKKTNERNLIKVRKYEDDAKKKDRQIEQLMDPVKNGDVRKLLSTKGAALLLNLKEQNNTLIQMILDKDSQIRRLMSDLRTAKLYASNAKRNQSYKSEIDRLRNLLIKSQSMMKEAQDTPQRRSICVGGTPTLEVTLTSDESSPRDLEELQFTIRSLEMHMKYSNELLAKKNEQIIRLTDQLNSLNAHRCSTCRRNAQTTYIIDPGRQCDFFPTEKESKEAMDCGWRVFDTQQREQPIERLRLPCSAPSSSLRTFQDPDPDSGHRNNVSSTVCPDSRDKLFQTSADYAKLPVNESQGDEIGDGRVESEAAHETNKRFNLIDVSDTERRRDSVSIISSGGGGGDDDSEMETAEFEMMEKKIENDQIEIESTVKVMPANDRDDGEQTGSPALSARSVLSEEERGNCEHKVDRFSPGKEEEAPAGCDAANLSDNDWYAEMDDLTRENESLSNNSWKKSPRLHEQDSTTSSFDGGNTNQVFEIENSHRDVLSKSNDNDDKFTCDKNGNNDGDDDDGDDDDDDVIVG